ncbi:hypothetical protein N665_1726s0008 [Sinapis alba]|nr:hypothetical protein N665_1726s0008 [Sinapis alba]
MKYNVMFMFSCVLTFLILNNVQEVEAKRNPKSKPRKLCETERMFPGTCGFIGSNTCIFKYRKNGFSINKGIRCHCSNHPIPGEPPRHKCTCQHDC